MKVKLWNGKVVEKILSRRLSARLRKLPYGHELYFDMSVAHEIHPIKDLLADHAVDDRIVRASGWMSGAAERKNEKRRPITIRREGKRLLIVDGSSTFVNALFSSWPDIPCVMQTASADDAGYEGLTLDAARAAVEKHLSDYNLKRYRSLLTSVKDVIGGMQQNPAPKGHIADFYTRSRKQGEGEEFKERNKIVLKYFKAIQEDPKFKVEDVIDIVGATVIVYYPDDIPAFLEGFISAAKEEDLILEPYRDPVTGTESTTKVHRDKGYHATHVKIISEAVDKSGLRIELQIKTMLHDAWGAKMHDLTYKPTGELDPSLKTLMESFGDSLEAIEVQSQTLRDAIEARVVLVRTLRRTARIQLMARLVADQVVSRARGSYVAALDRIKSRSDHLSKCAARDEELRDLLKSIDALEQDGVSAMEQLKLLVFLASFREDQILDRTIDEAIERWASENKDPVGGIFMTAAALHQTNRGTEATALIRSFIKRQGVTETTAVLAYNLANYIIEANIEQPSLRSSARAEVSELLAQVEPFSGKLDRSAYLDTKGAFLIVFGDGKDIDEGLRLIDEAIKVAGPNGHGQGYFELYKSYAWKRKLGL